MNDLEKINEIFDDTLEIGWGGPWAAWLEGSGEAAKRLAEYVQSVRREVWQEAYGQGAADEFTAIDLGIREYPHAARVNPYG